MYAGQRHKTLPHCQDRACPSHPRFSADGLYRGWRLSRPCFSLKRESGRRTQAIQSRQVDKVSSSPPESGEFLHAEKKMARDPAGLISDPLLKTVELNNDRYGESCADRP